MNNVPLINLSNLKSKVNKLDVDKLVVVPVYLNKLSDKVKHFTAAAANFVKKTDLDKSELNELSKKVISAKGLTKYFRNKFSILDGVK